MIYVILSTTLATTLLLLATMRLTGFRIIKRYYGNVNFVVTDIDLSRAEHISNKDECIVIQQVTISSLAKILTEKNLTFEEIKYIERAIDIVDEHIEEK